MKTEKGIVVNKMGEGISVRADWFENGTSIPIKAEDIDDCLPTAIKNLFKVRDGGKIEQSIFTH